MAADNIVRLNAHEERVAAAAAGCDPRTIRAYLDPAKRGRMHSTTRGRVEGTLRSLGHLNSSPVPTTAA